jgi:cbb3-type cytochrome oxidase maturation protein
MEIIYVLIPLSFIFLALAIYLFFWAVNNDQFSDLEGPGHSILFDDREKPEAPEPLSNEKDSEKNTNT